MIKTRFCPSPTGHMHVGNSRTALFNALLALKHNGVFLLRVEDTDQTRSHLDHADQLMRDLQWLMIPWQEGPEVEGENGPYWQSQRQAVYDTYYEQLEKNAEAYPCFCSEEQLALNRKIQRAGGQPPRYPGTCRNLSAQDIDAKLKKGIKPSLRFKVPQGQSITFEDGVRGHQVFNSDDIGDFIIRRADGTASFMYCNAIDDSLMKVNHALRGEDHLTNTPRQIMILQVLNLPAPNYAHISLILGSDGAPLSKRNGSQSIAQLREQGYLPLALLNYLARLGHHYPQDDFMSVAQLAERFELTQLNKSPARFDAQQLLHWQKEALMRANSNELVAWSKEYLQDIPEPQWLPLIQAIQANIIFPSDVKHWANALMVEALEHSADGIGILKEAGINYFETALEGLNEVGTDFKALTQYIKDKLNIKGKALFMPLRVALTGDTSGPEMAKVLPLQGLDLAKSRIEKALYAV